MKVSERHKRNAGGVAATEGKFRREPAKQVENKKFTDAIQTAKQLIQSS